MSSSDSDSDSGVFGRKSIWGAKPMRGKLYKRTRIPVNLHVQTSLNLTKPIEKKQKKKKKKYWGESSSDEDYASGSSSEEVETPDYGKGGPDNDGDNNGDKGDDDKSEQKHNDTGATVEDDEAGYESPVESSSLLGRAFSAAGGFLSSLPASAQKLRQRALGSAQKAIDPAVEQAQLNKTIKEMIESWKTAGSHARANLASQMDAVATDKPSESDPFSAQPIGTDESSVAAEAADPEPRQSVPKPLNPVDEAVKEKNLASQKKLAELNAGEQAVKALKARREKIVLEAQKALASAQENKAASSHERVTGVFSAAAKAGSQADHMEAIQDLLARIKEQQKDEYRKIEARELDPSIQTETEADVEGVRGAAAAPAPGSKHVIERWREHLKESKPYQEAESFIQNMPIDAKQKMLTLSEYTDMMDQYLPAYDEHVASVAKNLKGGNPYASISLANQYWQALVDYGWKHYKLLYERQSKIFTRAVEIEQRYLEERKADREARRQEKEARSHRNRLKELEQQVARSQGQGRAREVLSDEEESDAGTNTEGEPDFTKDAEAEVEEEEKQEKLTMNPSVPTITSRTLSKIPEAEELALFSQTLTRENKLNPANAVLILKRLDEILAAKHQKLEQKGLFRMPGFAIQATGKVVKSGKKSSYTMISGAIKRRIGELEKKMQQTNKASSSSSSSSSRSARSNVWLK